MGDSSRLALRHPSLSQRLLVRHQVLTTSKFTVLLFFLFFHSSVSLYILRNYEQNYYTFYLHMCSLLYILYIRITRYIHMYVIYGRFNVFSRVILTIRDFGFTSRL
jgi:hypothetical protein